VLVLDAWPGQPKGMCVCCTCDLVEQGVEFSVGYVILDKKYTLRGTVCACRVGLLGGWLVARAILGR